MHTFVSIAIQDAGASLSQSYKVKAGAIPIVIGTAKCDSASRRA